jgi:AraC-like DNA-binding protein
VSFAFHPPHHASAVRGVQQHVYYEERPSDSPVVERIWHTRSDKDDACIAIADGRWDMMFLSFEGETKVLITGPQISAIAIPHLAGSEWLGIRFRVGVTIPEIPLSPLVNEGIELPPTRKQSFWLKATSWQQPTYDNADTFIDYLMREETFATESSVMSIMRGEQPHWSTRTMQERFRQTTGLPFKTIDQIERAQRALVLLERGTSIADTVFQLGYYDHAHLTNSLRRFTGVTPSQIPRPSSA